MHIIQTLIHLFYIDCKWINDEVIFHMSKSAFLLLEDVKDFLERTQNYHFQSLEIKHRLEG